VALYKKLGAETGLDVGLSQVSNIRLARTQDRLDEYQYYGRVARDDRRVEVKFLTPQQLKEIGRFARSTAFLARSSTRRRLYPAGRPDAGAGARRPQRRGRNQPQHRVTAIERSSGANGKSSPTRATLICEHSLRRPAICPPDGAHVGINVPVIPSNINISSPSASGDPGA